MKVCYLCFRAFSLARTTSITAGSMDMNIIAMINTLEVLLYERKISEKVSRIAEKQYPESAAYQVVDHEIVIMHFTHSGYKGSESTDNRYESGDDYGFASIFFVELMRFVQMAFLEYLGVGIVK